MPLGKGDEIKVSGSTGATDERPFILVTGAMRSGTTLTGELLYSRAYREQRHPLLSFDNDEGVATRQVLGRGRGPKRWMPDTASIVREIIDLAPSAQMPQVLGAKVTHVLGGLDLLRHPFPHVLLVICVRDPVDIYRSHLVRTDKAPGEALTICKAINAIENLITTETDAMIIRYDDLISDPKAIVLRILQAVGLDPEVYDWSALETGRVASNSSFGPKRGWGFVQDAGIAPSSAVKDVSPLERVLVESSCEKTYLRHGFRLQTTPRERALLRGILP